LRFYNNFFINLNHILSEVYSNNNLNELID